MTRLPPSYFFIIMFTLILGSCGKAPLPDRQVEHGDSPDGFEQPYYAAFTGDLATLREHIEGGFDVNAMHPSTGWTTLAYAAGYSNIDVVQYLLDAGADVDAGIPALIHAARRGRLDNIQLLVDAGADANAAGQDGSTALTAAAKIGRLDICLVLIDGGADASKEDNHGRSAASYAEEEGFPDVARVLKHYEQP